MAKVTHDISSALTMKIQCDKKHQVRTLYRIQQRVENILVIANHFPLMRWSLPARAHTSTSLPSVLHGLAMHVHPHTHTHTNSKTKIPRNYLFLPPVRQAEKTGKGGDEQKRWMYRYEIRECGTTLTALRPFLFQFIYVFCHFVLRSAPLVSVDCRFHHFGRAINLIYKIVCTLCECVTANVKTISSAYQLHCNNFGNMTNFWQFHFSFFCFYAVQ